MAPEAFPATRGRKEVGREWERGSGLNKPGGLQWGHPNYWGKLLPLTLQTFWNFAPTEVEVGGWWGVHGEEEGRSIPFGKGRSAHSAILRGTAVVYRGKQCPHASWTRGQDPGFSGCPGTRTDPNRPKIISFGIQSKVWGWKQGLQ